MKAVFELLDDLRDSGTMNMMGAPRYLLDSGLVDTKEEAREVFQAWQNYLSLGEVS